MTHNGGEGSWFRSRQGGEDEATEGVDGHYSTGVGGLIAMVFILVFLYPALVVLTQPLHPLSSTAIVFIALLGWLGAWLVLELVVDWGLGN